MEFHRLGSAGDPLFTEAFALYERSFPEHEQRLPDRQRALMSNPLYHFDIVEDDGVFAGILLYWEFSFYTYVEHFAIHPSMRGKSLGSRALETFCGRRTTPLVVLEIDPPVNDISIRRESFYQKLGFKRNNYAHKHPAYRKQFPPHELVVMSCPECMAEDEYQTFRRDLNEIVMSDAEA
jgi:ribosomal protein S18 acetylase RimI-like enzyme